MNILVGIIVPVYNASKYLARCIESIINQTYKNLEIILVDDGSTDSSYSICLDYKRKDSRITVIHTENKGVSSARNIGLENSSGQWVYFVDSDDWIGEKAIENLLEEPMDAGCLYLHQAATASLRNGGTDFYCKEWPYSFYDSLIELEDVRDLRLLDEILIYGTPWGKLYNRDVIIKNNICFDANISFHEDHCFYFEYLSKINRIKVISSVQYYYRTDNDSKSLSRDRSFHNPYKLLYSADLLAAFFDRIVDIHNIIGCLEKTKSFIMGIRLSALRNAVVMDWKYFQIKPIFNQIETSAVKLYYKPETIAGKQLKCVFLIPNKKIQYFILKLIHKTLKRI